MGWLGGERRSGFEAFQQHLNRDLGAEAAGVGLAGGEAAVFPEFVAAVAATAEAEVFTAVVAGLHTAAHVREEALELIGLGGLHQGHVLQVSQVEGAVAIACYRQELRVEGGEVALPVDAEDGEGAVQFVLGHALVPLDQADHLLELAQNHGIAVLFTEVPEG